jgi:histidine ammonia-lyase
MSYPISEPILVGNGQLGIDTLVRVAVHGAPVRLPEDPAWTRRVTFSEELLVKAVAAGMPIYGVTTGFGSNCRARITVESVRELRGGLSGRPAVAAEVRAIRALSPALAHDRPLDIDIEAVYQALSSGPLGQPVATVE